MAHGPQSVSLTLGFFQIPTHFRKSLEEHIQDVCCFFSHFSIDTSVAHFDMICFFWGDRIET